MKFKELQQEDFALDFLSTHLINGSLVLFLGAGISKDFGFPGWLEFTNSFRKEVGLSEIDKSSSTEVIQSSIDEAIDVINDDEIRKMSIVKKILYPVHDNLDVNLAFNSHLLISISSLLIGRKRGHVKRVITLNYDSMLEWFLSLFGFQVNSINELPSLEGSEDVRIYHLHGFAPHPKLQFSDSKFLILGLKDANKRIGDRDNFWRDKLRQIIESGVCLFIGMSGESLSDRAIAPILSSTGDIFKAERPLGIWIYKGDLSPEKEKEYFRNNIVPLIIHDKDKISEFILKISQKALEKLK